MYMYNNRVMRITQPKFLQYSVLWTELDVCEIFFNSAVIEIKLYMFLCTS